MMIKEKNLTNAEKKRIESLDKRIEKIQTLQLAHVSFRVPPIGRSFR